MIGRDMAAVSAATECLLWASGQLQAEAMHAIV